MSEKMNLSEILKKCPEGTKLYSPIFGDCTLKTVGDYLITVVCSKVLEHNFYSDGSYCKEGECLLFPSKDQRDWSEFQTPFEDGDVICYDDGWTCIFKNIHGIWFSSYCFITDDGEFHTGYEWHAADSAIRGNVHRTTKEQCDRLFQKIKEAGYKWNPETKTLEKINPKFKVGNLVKKHKDYISGVVTNISDDGEYKVEYQGGGVSYINLAYQDEWELDSSKFDINTLEPFESRVLVRDRDNDEWRGQFFSHYNNCSDRPYICIGNEGLAEYKQCIPYEGNKHLLGKTDSCDDFYKTW